MLYLVKPQPPEWLYLLKFCLGHEIKFVHVNLRVCSIVTVIHYSTIRESECLSDHAHMFLINHNKFPLVDIRCPHLERNRCIYSVHQYVWISFPNRQNMREF